MWPLILGSIASAAIPAVASAFGQHKANQTNVKLSRQGMAFEADQVAKQMQFQERMSGTAYQRATEDMRLAGINPMLAYAQGGASTPGGGAASGAAATVEDVVGPAVASAQHARRLHQELKNMRQSEETTYYQGQQAAAGARSAQSQAHLNVALEREADARTANLGVQTALGMADLPARQVAGRVGGGRFGTATEYLRRGVSSLAPLGAAAGIFGGLRFLGRAGARPSVGGSGSGSARTYYFPASVGSSARNLGTRGSDDLYDLWKNTYTRSGR